MKRAHNKNYKDRYTFAALILHHSWQRKFISLEKQDSKLTIPSNGRPTTRPCSGESLTTLQKVSKSQRHVQQLLITTSFASVYSYFILLTLLIPLESTVISKRNCLRLLRHFEIHGKTNACSSLISPLKIAVALYSDFPRIFAVEFQSFHRFHF